MCLPNFIKLGDAAIWYPRGVSSRLWVCLQQQYVPLDLKLVPQYNIVCILKSVTKKRGIESPKKYYY